MKVFKFGEKQYERRFSRFMHQPHKMQTHSYNSLAAADELFECVWVFCEVGT